MLQMHAQKCAVRGCPHWRVEEDNDTFYKFPDNNKLREKWRLACGMSNAPRGSIICGVHFTKDLFKPNTRPGSTRKLRADAIPNQLLVSTEQWDNIPADPAVANSSLQVGKIFFRNLQVLRQIFQMCCLLFRNWMQWRGTRVDCATLRSGEYIISLIVVRIMERCLIPPKSRRCFK